MTDESKRIELQRDSSTKQYHHYSHSVTHYFTQGGTKHGGSGGCFSPYFDVPSHLSIMYCLGAETALDSSAVSTFLVDMMLAQTEKLSSTKLCAKSDGIFSCDVLRINFFIV